MFEVQHLNFYVNFEWLFEVIIKNKATNFTFQYIIRNLVSQKQAQPKMDIDEQISLRYRFDKVVTKSYDDILNSCEQLKEKVEPDYKIKVSGHHIWLNIGMLHREKHSPHLHLEIEKMEDGNTFVRGLYGPDPVLWTLFMFLHFVVAGIFVIFSMIAFSKWSLNQAYGFDLVVMFAMVNIWFLLYFIARLNRKKGLKQAKELEILMERILED